MDIALARGDTFGMTLNFSDPKKPFFEFFRNDVRVTKKDLTQIYQNENIYFFLSAFGSGDIFEIIK